MQKIKTSTSHGAFFTNFQTIYLLYDTRFSKHNFKKPDAFSKYVKFSTSYQGSKLLNNYPTMEETISSAVSFLNEEQKKSLCQRIMN